MSEPEQEELHPRDAQRGIIQRKRVPPPGEVGSQQDVRDQRGRVHPDGVMWPSDGFEADQFSPAGEVAAFSNLFQAIQRRWRRRR